MDEALCAGGQLLCPLAARNTGHHIISQRSDDGAIFARTIAQGGILGDDQIGRVGIGVVQQLGGPGIGRFKDIPGRELAAMRKTSSSASQ